MHYYLIILLQYSTKVCYNHHCIIHSKSRPENWVKLSYWVIIYWWSFNVIVLSKVFVFHKVFLARFFVISMNVKWFLLHNCKDKNKAFKYCMCLKKKKWGYLSSSPFSPMMRLHPWFPRRDVNMWGGVWMSCFRGPWQSLNFDKEYLFGFETLISVTSGILSMHNQLETLQRESNTWNHHMTPLMHLFSALVYISMCVYACVYMHLL